MARMYGNDECPSGNFGEYRAAGDSDNRRTERTPRKFFRSGPEDHLN